MAPPAPAVLASACLFPCPASPSTTERQTKQVGRHRPAHVLSVFSTQNTKQRPRVGSRLEEARDQQSAVCVACIGTSVYTPASRDAVVLLARLGIHGRQWRRYSLAWSLCVSGTTCKAIIRSPALDSRCVCATLRNFMDLTPASASIFAGRSSVLARIEVAILFSPLCHHRLGILALLPTTTWEGRSESRRLSADRLCAPSVSAHSFSAPANDAAFARLLDAWLGGKNAARTTGSRPLQHGNQLSRLSPESLCIWLGLAGFF